MAKKSKAVKKVAAKKIGAKKAAPGGGELKAFQAATQQLKTAGAALVKAAKADPKLRTSPAVRKALVSARNTVAAISKAIGPPTSIVT